MCDTPGHVHACGTAGTTHTVMADGSMQARPSAAARMILLRGTYPSDQQHVGQVLERCNAVNNVAASDTAADFAATSDAPGTAAAETVAAAPAAYDA
eukprot:1155329-Pelagomonas_calceolata.AAC.4